MCVSYSDVGMQSHCAFFFFFQAEDGIRDVAVTGVQTCALPILLPLERIAASNLVAADVMDALVGARGGALVAGLALLVVLASLNGNVFVTPRVLFGLARDGLAPGALARVNAGGTPWVAMLAIGVFAIALAATGTFELLLGLAIVQVLVIDSWAVIG